MKSPIPTIRIAIADDHTLAREGLKALLQLQAGLLVVTEIVDPHELPARLVDMPCDVLLLDPGFQRGGFIDVRELSEITNVLMLCSNADDLDGAMNAVRAGVRGTLGKRSTVEDVISAIRTVAAGHVWMPPELQERAAEALHEEARGQLTFREREIVREVGLGLRNREIAKVLFISVQTVKTHLSRIFRKVGVRDRAALTLYASRIGLVDASAAHSRRRQAIS
jgi:DNA-binding NarL/FixJ family response regulator